jgi:hypothetical protein
MFNLHRAMQISRIVVALAASLPCAALAQQFYPAGGGSSAIAVGSSVTGGSSGCVMFDNSSGNLGCDNGFIYSGAGGAIGFSSSIDLIWNSDTALSRLGAGSLMLSHGTSATKSTVSATTDSLTSRTNYADAYLQAGINAGEFDLGSEHGGSATGLTKFGLYVDGTLQADYNKTAPGVWILPNATGLTLPTNGAGLTLGGGTEVLYANGLGFLETDTIVWWHIQVGAGTPETSIGNPATGVVSIDTGAGANGLGAIIAANYQAGVVYSAAATPLPTCNSGLKGTRAAVSDATSPTFLGAYTSGGAVASGVLCNGSGWVTN